MLLHTCCAPCSAAVIEWLLAENIRPVLYFFNPNIYPEEEYLRRKAELTRYARSQALEVIDGDADHDRWRTFVIQHPNDERAPERSARCLRCFQYRLSATAQLAAERGFTRFATTLASSRWKDLAQIAEAGHRTAAQTRLLSGAEVQFFDKNWRKDGLSERRRALLAENKFYNQTYCGCEFSKNNVPLPSQKKAMV